MSIFTIKVDRFSKRLCFETSGLRIVCIGLIPIFLHCKNHKFEVIRGKNHGKREVLVGSVSLFTFLIVAARALIMNVRAR